MKDILYKNTATHLLQFHNNRTAHLQIPTIPFFITQNTVT